MAKKQNIGKSEKEKIMVYLKKYNGLEKKKWLHPMFEVFIFDIFDGIEQIWFIYIRFLYFLQDLLFIFF